MLPTFSVQFDNFLHSVDEYSFQPSKCYNEGKLTWHFSEICCCIVCRYIMVFTAECWWCDNNNSVWNYSSTMAVYASPQASPYRGRVLTCAVLLLDDTEQIFQIPVSSAVTSLVQDVWPTNSDSAHDCLLHFMNASIPPWDSCLHHCISLWLKGGNGRKSQKAWFSSDVTILPKCSVLPCFGLNALILHFYKNFFCF